MGIAPQPSSPAYDEKNKLRETTKNALDHILETVFLGVLYLIFRNGLPRSEQEFRYLRLGRNQRIL
jgi:hypothetical protein